MSSLLEVPAYLIMAFSLVLEAPDEKASRVPAHIPEAPSISSPAPKAQIYSVLEDEWLRAVKTASPRSDILQIYASRIFVTSTGRHYVVNDGDRADLLALSRNAEVVEHVMAAEITELRGCLANKLGRAPYRSMLLVAHYFGCDVAFRYAKALEASPHVYISEALPHVRFVSDAKATMVLADAQLQRAAMGRGPAVRREIVAGNSAPERFAFGKSLMKGSIAATDKSSPPRLATAR